MAIVFSVPTASAFVSARARRGLALRRWLAGCVWACVGSAAMAATQAPSVPARRADLAGENASAEARHVANWVMHSRDHQGRPFLIVDKARARLFVFASDGRLRGAAPILLGLARGDHSVPGIGEREMASILPEERTTPAGRFVAEHGKNMKGEDIFWVDYDAAVSLHRVRPHNPAERRLERLATPTAADNRISYGCINVPVAFYNQVVRPTLAGVNGIVYVLPETQSARQLFGSYDVTDPARRHARADAPRPTR